MNFYLINNGKQPSNLEPDCLGKITYSDKIKEMLQSHASYSGGIHPCIHEEYGLGFITRAWRGGTAGDDNQAINMVKSGDAHWQFFPDEQIEEQLKIAETYGNIDNKQQWGPQSENAARARSLFKGIKGVVG